MAAQMAVNSEASLWGPLRELWETLEGAMWSKKEESIHLLDRQLKKHKSHFMSLYKNPPKSAEQREKLRKASTEGIAIQGQRGSQLLPEELVTEALILSDLFDMGEVAALELLLAGERLQPHFPGLTRGLVAVLLYWDGKLSVASSLRSLIQCRHSSKTFSLELSGELVALATHFTDGLMSHGLTRRILDLVLTIDVQRQFESLQKYRGLGNEKHRREVSDLITECRQALAGCLFSWTCQSPLVEDDTLALIGHLETVTAEADGSLDSVNLALVMALLSCLDVSFLEQGTEDGEDLLQVMPLLTERHYVSAVHRRLMDRRPWKLPGLQAVCRLAWALTLRALSQLPQGSALVEFTNEDEALAEKALQADVFLFLKEHMLGCEGFAKEELYIRRFHSLLTDFLALMPMKVKKLRDRAEEDVHLVHMSLKTGNEPPSSLIKKDLDHLMTLIGEFYSKDPFSLELALGFWCPTDSVQHTSPHGSYLGMALQRPPHKQVVLSKFVHQMGDMLPSTLCPLHYMAYLRMLKGLANGPQCANNCYKLLKTNRAPHGANLQGVAVNQASWEHFFHALMLYHDNLKQDRPNPDTAQYHHCPLKGINQRELDGITSFLDLFTTIITWSEDARLALFEQWAPVMLGLLQCSIPLVLKAELMRCLSAFGRSPEIAASLWQSLEYAQILQTVKPAGQQTAGIEVELTEVESSAKEYPLTRAFCQLISTLVESGLPVNLGAGLRVPGFQPYLAFLQDSVFLPFLTRPYHRPAEKWEVADVVLEVFHKLLQDYEPQPSDFVQETLEPQGKQLPAHKHPGNSIMFHLLTDSTMLALCLRLLEDGIHQLDTYSPLPGQKQLESAVLHCLCLLELALQKEVVYMDLLRESQASLSVFPLEQLLHEVSRPQSRRANHVVTVASYLYHNSSNPDAAFQSAKILCHIARYPNIQMRLVGDFTNDQTVSDRLMAGFIECLDNVHAEEGTETVDDSDPIKKWKKVAKIRHETQIHILNLLITSLELKAPNLSLYLLGYEVKKPVSTNLQDPGVLGCPRSCLHAILNMLQRGSDKKSGPVLKGQAPHLAALCYQLIYQLCACSETSGPTMRYLRTSHDFLFSQLQHLPFVLPGDPISALYQMSWLMKTAAIELLVTSMNRQRFHVQRLANLLLDDQPHTQHTADGESGIEEETRSDTVPKVRRKLLSVLDTINFSQDSPELPQLGFFEPTQIEEEISKYEHVNEQGQTMCNVKLLYQVLVAEVNTLQGMAAIGQRSLLIKEVNSILEYVVERNYVHRTLSAKRHALQSWRSLVETLLTACPTDLIPAEDRQLIIRDLLLDLHDKVLSEDATEELMPNVAEAVFTLTTHLGLSLQSDHQQGVGLEVGGVSSGFASIANSDLHLILHKLLNFILRTGGGSQRLRIHLYCSLLNVLEIAQKPDEPDMLQSGNAMWERLTAPEDGFSKLQKENLAIIQSYGTALMEVVCRDACDGHKSRRMLALKVMDRILSIEKDRTRLDSILSSQWLMYVRKSGCLRELVESLKQDDVALQNLLTTQPPVLEPLYVYESKMALLTRIAKTGLQGAMELLQCGLVSNLIDCRVFDMLPCKDSHRTTRDPSGLISSPLDRYRQILLPTLNLFQVILISTSTHHQQGAAHSTSIHHPQGAAQVLMWLVEHVDTIQSLLCQDLSMGSLQQLSLLTGIISKTALPGVLDICEKINSDVLKSHIKRFRHLCLSLLGRLAGSERERLLKHAEMDAPGDPAECREEMEVAMQQVCANIMEYCHSLLLQSSAQAQFSVCLFGPSRSKPGDRDGTHEPGLGLVLYLIKNSAADFFRVQQSHRQSVEKLKCLDQLPPEELKEQYQGLVSGPGGLEKISPVQWSLLAKRRLVQLINNRAKLLALCSYVIETSLFVLWRHLEYYLLYCTPTDRKDSLLPEVSGIRSRLDGDFGGLRGTGGRVLGQFRVSQQDLEQLRSDMAADFGEAIQRKLREVEELDSLEGSYGQGRSRYPIIQPLICNIHTLLRQPKSSNGKLT